MRRRVQIWAAAALLALLTVQAQATVIPEDVTDALPPQAAERLEGLEGTPDHTTWAEGLRHLWDEARQYAADALRSKADI